ncbi:alpha/beta fold hydrolase [Alicyclobacillus sp. TC]|uniref:Proline iminopeptidase n=3 Tax=Alicyclobacillus tolerans TaxID=90970 RepID=A0ABT9LYA6_9BACL|nr:MULTISPECIES: proline iminopeptidase-family hydrolase [Alicyclobacillus]MDP9729247.1 proline iminopeptidase [Alicyclobacillus tengchongensis]QRF22292.1 alpha/beta fold hydrolase [Alicyclobacillus sp. TC]SHK10113.1 proline iminopeptidase [Alicyclobacillus montanus]
MSRYASSKIIQLSNGYHVWTRRVGESPIKMLLLHGGPGSTHTYMKIFENYLPPAGIEIYFYDQLGSYCSDQPDDISLWNVERFCEEVEEVRTALGLDHFYLCGQSWGGFLAIEYALHHGHHLKGLIISNMVASIQSYMDYIHILRKQLPIEVQKNLEYYENKGEYDAPEYQDLLFKSLYRKHLCRLDPWPSDVQHGFALMNNQVYNTMQGPNEFVITGNFKDWNRWEDLAHIHTPCLVIGARYDTMNPNDLIEMARRMPNAQSHICENGSHLAMWDDAESYFSAIQQFISKVEEN